MCPENGNNAENKFCVSTEASGGKCPVTSIHFMEKATKDTDGFEYVDFDQKYKIGFSNSFDSLPVTEFQVTPG